MKKLEIERKFLLKDFSYNLAVSKLPLELREKARIINIQQYYLPNGDRVRRSCQEHPYIENISNPEEMLEFSYIKKTKIADGIFEEEDKVIEARDFFTYRSEALSEILKRRCVIPIEGSTNVIEVDIYTNLRLITAEIEYTSEEEFNNSKSKPLPWVIDNYLIKELTGDDAFSNKSLSIKL